MEDPSLLNPNRDRRLQRRDNCKDLCMKYSHGLHMVSCYSCTIDINPFDSHSSHVRAARYDGPSALWNLRLCCPTCNLGCGSRNLHDYIKGRGSLDGKWNPHVGVMREDHRLFPDTYPDPNSLLRNGLVYPEEPGKEERGVKYWFPIPSERIVRDEIEGSDSEEDEQQDNDEEQLIVSKVHVIMNATGKWKRTILIIMKEILGNRVNSETIITSKQLKTKIPRIMILAEVNPEAKTVPNTLSRELQELRNRGLILFLGQGRYKLTQELVNDWEMI